MGKIFSFDAETNGLWGQAFCIGAILYAEGTPVATFVGRCPIEGATNEWVAANVIPTLENIPVEYSSYDELLAAFSKFYLEHKQDAAVIAHVAVPVESKLLSDMHSRGYIGDWDGPFPLIDVAGMLYQAGEDPTSVDAYVNKYGIAVENYGSTHNPLYDCAVAAQVFMRLRG